MNALTQQLKQPPAQSLDTWDSTGPWVRTGMTWLGGSLGLLVVLSFISISGAVVSQGTVSVETSYKAVQHLDGGIVHRILVKNGDAVKEGDVLVRLDDTQVKATRDVTRGRLLDALTQRARLEAERDNRRNIERPEEFSSELADPLVSRMLETQTALFRARQISRLGEQSVLKQRLEQALSELNGLTRVREARTREHDLNLRELQNVLPLFERGFTNQQRLGPLQKEQARLDGEIGRLAGDFQRLTAAASEAQQRLAQTDKEFLSQVTEELRRVEGQVVEFRETLRGLDDKLARTQIRAPRKGRVHNLVATTEGGVISPASQIAQVIPDGEKLVVEVRINPQDIDKVRGGLPAGVRFPAFNAKTTPRLEGHVTTVSPAQITDRDQPQKAYFVAQIELDAGELAKLGTTRTLIPGMPAEVFIETQSRSIMSYIVKPLVDTVSTLFRD